MLDPKSACTSDTCRAVDLVIPDGAICSALLPDGAVFACGESTKALIAAMFQAMSKVLGEQAAAITTGLSLAVTLSGTRKPGCGSHATMPE